MVMSGSRFVRVKYVNSPKKEGGKYGNIKLDNDELVWVPVDQLRLFEAGREYEIISKRQKWGNDWQDVLDRVVYGNGGGGGGSRGSSTAPTTGSAGYRQTGGGAGQARPEQAMMIFVTGIVGRAVGSGKFGPDDVSAWTKAAIDAWFKGQVYIAKLSEDLANDGAEPEPQQEPQRDFSRDPNDEIPF